MSDKEKIIKGLRHCTDETTKYCGDCPYSLYNINDAYAYCILHMMKDILKLLEYGKE